MCIRDRDEGAGCGCGDFEPHGEFEGDGAEECAGILDDEDLQDEGAAGGDQHGADVYKRQGLLWALGFRRVKTIVSKKRG